MIERQELHCHNCNQYVQFDVDLELEGNHVFKCPVCQHEHCRVVIGGRITGERWDQRNGMTWTIPTNTLTYSSTSTWTNYSTTSASNITGGDYFLYNSWMNTTTDSTGIYITTA